MALPAGILTGLGELATNAKVQEFAAGLVRNVYGKIMPSRAGRATAPGEAPARATLDDLAARIDNIPTREEITAAFALLQAELDRRQGITARIVYAVAAAQIVTIVLLVAIWLR